MGFEAFAVIIALAAVLSLAALRTSASEERHDP